MHQIYTNISSPQGSRSNPSPSLRQPRRSEVQRERALCHTQETPIANAAASSVKPRIRRHDARGAARRSWRDSATAISERLGLDNFPGKASLRACLRGATGRESLSPLPLVPCRALRTIPIQHPGSLLQTQPCPVYLQQMYSFGQTGLPRQASVLGLDSTYISIVSCTPMKRIRPALRAWTSGRKRSP